MILQNREGHENRGEQSGQAGAKELKKLTIVLFLADFQRGQTQIRREIANKTRGL